MKKSTKSLEQFDQEIQQLAIEKQRLFDNLVSSKKPDDILKAESYFKKIAIDSKSPQPQAYIFNPEREYYSGSGYKETIKRLTFDMMRGMARAPQIYSVISTRIEQVLNFSQFSSDDQRPGWTVRRKLSRFDDRKTYKLKDSDKKVIDEIATFLEDGGLDRKFDLNADDLPDFLRMITKDTLELDQVAFECYDNRRMDLTGFKALDASSIRLLESVDRDSPEKVQYDDEKLGYIPAFAQVYQNKVLKRDNEPIVWYPWELGWGIRNKSTEFSKNGYGTSELEILIEIVTWMLWGMQYNGNFFKQGSNPKGFFVIEGQANPNVLNDFRQSFRQMVMGVDNAHKVPIFSGKEKISWQDMQHSNKDMEFQLWNEFLTTISCAVYKIDPSELGFNFKSGQSQMFGQDGQKERLDHSQNKGLKPLLKFLQKVVNKYIVSRLNTEFEFAFTGIELDDELQMVENDIKKLNGGLVSLQDVFKKYNYRELNTNKDIILNPVFLNWLMQNSMGGAESNEAVDRMTGEEQENPFEQEYDNNPIMKATLDNLQKELSK